MARVLVVGGYGVFGSRLCELLCRDGHDVTIAGRDLARARALAERLGCQARRIDNTGDLAPVLEAAPGVVIDAAGPFHAYGTDPYRLARFCIEHGFHYLDLSDDAGLSAGISGLDPTAREAGVFAISGASSVPGLSSAAVAELSAGMDRIDLIESAILPGNRAPRGQSVIASILNQIGRPMRIWRGGAWRETPAWSEQRAYDLAPGLRRSAWLISVPDLALFPAAFRARAVLFRAGLELGVMNRGLQVFALLRRIGLAAPSPAWVRLMHWLASLLEPFGTDRGAMVVDVVGRVGARHLRRRWQLLAEAGDGPFIPAIAARTILLAPGEIPPGARACVAAFPLTAAEAAMRDLAVTTAREETPAEPLFQRALGPAWDRLDPAHRRTHEVFDTERLSGRATVTRGTGPLARLLALAFRFPNAGADIPVSVTKTVTQTGETWERDFAGRRFLSRLSPAGAGRVAERFGPFRFELDLPVADARMALTVRRGWLLGVPLPRVLLPGSDAVEYVEDGRFRFDVGLIAPLGGGMIVRYRGWLAPETDSAHG